MPPEGRTMLLSNSELSQCCEGAQPAVYQQCALRASQPTCKHCTVYKWCTPHASVAYVCVGLMHKYAPC